MLGEYIPLHPCVNWKRAVFKRYKQLWRGGADRNGATMCGNSTRFKSCGGHIVTLSGLVRNCAEGLQECGLLFSSQRCKISARTPRTGTWNNSDRNRWLTRNISLQPTGRRGRMFVVLHSTHLHARRRAKLNKHPCLCFYSPGSCWAGPSKSALGWTGA